jgi:hypothetical protein
MDQDPKRPPAPILSCEGWWEQDHLGRQPMEDLRLRFGGGRIEGSGRDMVGPFVFSGTISEAGQVGLVKQYLGRHRVDYHGTYDGEGVLWGQWQIGFDHGPWMIKIGSVLAEGDGEIRELVPQGSEGQAHHG